jgi:hypothetical protein
VWTGSANATDAAFNGNVEFLVELLGKKSRCGIQAVLGPPAAGQTTFGSLLQAYTPTPTGDSPDGEQELLERQLEDTRRQVARARLIAEVSAGDDALFRVQLLHRGDRRMLPENVSAQCWPITLPEHKAVGLALGGEPVALFDAVPFEGLTTFFALAVTATRGDRRAKSRFVLTLPLEGAPQDRRERLLRLLLRDRAQVMRLMLLLLAEGNDDISQELLTRSSAEGKDGDAPSGEWGLPLFETMVRALDRNPASLDQLVRLVEDLRKTSDGDELLPDGFELIWQPLCAARERLRR